jgi:hypothetical protein
MHRPKWTPLTLKFLTSRMSTRRPTTPPRTPALSTHQTTPSPSPSTNPLPNTTAQDEHDKCTVLGEEFKYIIPYLDPPQHAQETMKEAHYKSGPVRASKGSRKLRLTCSSFIREPTALHYLPRHHSRNISPVYAYDLSKNLSLSYIPHPQRRR